MSRVVKYVAVVTAPKVELCPTWTLFTKRVSVPTVEPTGLPEKVAAIE
jgi:hypothetical protein